MAWTGLTRVVQLAYIMMYQMAGCTTGWLSQWLRVHFAGCRAAGCSIEVCAMCMCHELKPSSFKSSCVCLISAISARDSHGILSRHIRHCSLVVLMIILDEHVHSRLRPVSSPQNWLGSNAETIRQLLNKQVFHVAFQGSNSPTRQQSCEQAMPASCCFGFGIMRRLTPPSRVVRSCLPSLERTLSQVDSSGASGSTSLCSNMVMKWDRKCFL